MAGHAQQAFPTLLPGHTVNNIDSPTKHSPPLTKFSLWRDMLIAQQASPTLLPGNTANNIDRPTKHSLPLTKFSLWWDMLNWHLLYSAPRSYSS